MTKTAAIISFHDIDRMPEYISESIDTAMMTIAKDQHICQSAKNLSGREIKVGENSGETRTRMRTKAPSEPYKPYFMIEFGLESVRTSRYCRSKATKRHGKNQIYPNQSYHVGGLEISTFRKNLISIEIRWPISINATANMTKRQTFLFMSAES